MYYSVIGVIAILVLFIENFDILFNRNKSISDNRVWKSFRLFLIAVFAYYLTDVLWGLFDYYKLATVLYVDTVLYFLAMAAGVIYWTNYVVDYVGEDNIYAKILLHFGRIFALFVAVLLIINIFNPILFEITEDCTYEAYYVRYVILITQIVLLVLVSIYAFILMAKESGTKMKRYRTVALFGLIMATFLTVQLWFPLLPLYSIAYMMGTCLLHTFVINDEKEEYKEELEESFVREMEQYEKLKSALQLAYTDALTGAESKLAYIQLEARIDQKIKNGEVEKFALAVFDVNDLKKINDKYGHETGDKFIINSYKIIVSHFNDSKVYRIGGDEFMAFVNYDEFANLEKLKEEFIDIMSRPKVQLEPVIAIGLAKYENEDSFNDVFRKADKLMYENKKMLKRLQ